PDGRQAARAAGRRRRDGAHVRPRGRRQRQRRDPRLTGRVFKRVLIVGGGVAAMRCAVELRSQGYDGHVRMLSAETTLPYDRPLVSKQLRGGESVDDDRLLLQPADAYADAAIDVRLGVRACGLDVRGRRVELTDGSQLPYDRLVVAVGGEPVRPP